MAHVGKALLLLPLCQVKVYVTLLNTHFKKSIYTKRQQYRRKQKSGFRLGISLVSLSHGRSLLE